MKERQRAAAASIPERLCMVCNYKPAKNSNPKLTRHLTTQKHLNNLAILNGTVSDNNICNVVSKGSSSALKT